MRLSWFCLVLSVSVVGVAVMGCSNNSTEPKKATPEAEAPPKGPPRPPVLAEPGGTDLPYPRGGRVEITDQDQGGGVTQRVKAQVGVGAKGRSLEDERMVKAIVAPAVALFRTRERAVFEIQIPHAMQLYEALNGKKPVSEEEFFEKIIKTNQIKLPTLPEGQRYVYDPKKGELMVERPAR